MIASRFLLTVAILLLMPAITVCGKETSLDSTGKTEENTGGRITTLTSIPIAIIDFDTYSVSERYESLKFIKQYYPNIPIILLCNIIPHHLRNKLNQKNIITYQQKPVSGKELEQLIYKKLY